MTQEQPERGSRPRLELKAAQVAGGALAATTSAVAASQLGVAGTVAGAAVGSVVATVGTEVYTTTLRTAREGVTSAIRLAPRVRLGSAAASGSTSAGSEALDSAGGSVAVEARTGPDGADGGAGRARRPARRWALAGAAVAMFGIALGTLSVGELIAGRPVADIVTGTPGSGTTVGRVVDPASADTPSTVQPAEAPAGTQPGPVGSTEPTPAAEATPPADSASPAPQPTPPAPAPTSGPAPAPTGAPVPQGDGSGQTGTGTGDQSGGGTSTGSGTAAG